MVVAVPIHEIPREHTVRRYRCKKGAISMPPAASGGSKLSLNPIHRVVRRDVTATARVYRQMHAIRLWVALSALMAFAGACAEPGSPSRPISITPASAVLFTGDTTRFRTTGLSSAIRWYSAAPTIASVDRTGLATALTPGTAAVWAVRGTDSATASVEVFARPKCLLAVVMSPPNATVAPGDTVHAEARFGCGSVSGGFAWASADTSIAVVNAHPTDAGRSAVITARRPGQVVITAAVRDDPIVTVAMALVVRAP